MNCSPGRLKSSRVRTPDCFNKMSKCLEAREHGAPTGLKEIHYGWMINVREKIANGWGDQPGPNYARPNKSR